MQDMQLGGYTVQIQWESFTDGNFAMDTVGAALNGNLVVASCMMPHTWMGTILISPDVAGGPTVTQLEALWLTKGPVAFVDYNGVAHSIIIDSPMTIVWDDNMAKYGTLAFKFIEVQS